MVEETKNYRNETYYEIVLNAVAFVYTNMYYIIIKALENLEEFYDEKSFTEAFVIRYHLDEKLNEYINENLKEYKIDGHRRDLGLRNYAIAVNLKIAEKDLIYKDILELDNKSEDEKRVAFSSLDNYMSNYRNILAKKKIKV